IESGPNQAAFRTPLAECLRLSATLAAARDRFGPASAAADEAVRGYADLVAAGDSRVRPRLAETLELAARYARAGGDIRLAVNRTSAAVEVRRDLVAAAATGAGQEEALDGLVRALTDLGDLLVDDGAGPAAHAARVEATEVARRLHQLRPG